MKKLPLALLGLALVAMPLLAAATPARPNWRPEIAGPWRTLFRPTIAGNYLNDHCVYQDPKGDWHLVGITSTKSPMTGTTEKWFAHGITPSLLEPMRELPALFKGWPDNKMKFAPHAIWEGDTLHLFAGPGAIRHFTSRDGSAFQFVGIAVKNSDPFLRDTMVLRLPNGTWVMYATSVYKRVDSIVAWVSQDLYKWTLVGPVFSSVRPAPAFAPVPNSACESPFVIRRDDGYYLSTTLTTSNDQTYLNTMVFFSDDPLWFGRYRAAKGGDARLVTTLSAHAAELIEEKTADGGSRWWITNAGWPGFPRPDGCPDGQACIAPLEWKAMR